MNILLWVIFGALYFSPLSDREQLEATTALTAGTLLLNIETASLWIFLRFLRFDPSVKRFSKDVMEDTGITALLRDMGIPTKGSSGTNRPPPYSPYDYTSGQYTSGQFGGGYGQQYYPYMYQ